jgi:hypothetical protein
MKTLVYTALFGRLTQAHKPTPFDQENADCICFSDRNLTLPGWKVRRLPLCWAGNLAAVKVLKCLPFMLGDYDRSLWIDAHVRMRRSLTPMFDIMNDLDLICFLHNRRQTISEEYKRCLVRRKDSRDRLAYTYAQTGNTDGLYLGGILWRRHTPAIEEFGKQWLFQIMTGTSRDQISMPWALEQSGVKFAALDRVTRSKLIMIHNKR